VSGGNGREFPPEIAARRYDVIVAGGGPAGSTIATILAQHGRKVLLVERSREPQFKLGESLQPQTYWTLERLGMLDRMRASAFPKKYSVQFVSSNGRYSQPFYFSEVDPRPSSQTWQVLRKEFDPMLLDNAAEHGVEVHRGVAVQEVLFDGERAVGARLRLDEGRSIDVASSVFADATGQSTVLARRFSLMRMEPRLKNASFYTHFEGARRDEGIDEGATLVLNTEGKRSWFWFIPLRDNVVSIGAVGPIEHLIKNRVADPQRVFEEELARCPALVERLTDARPLWPVQATRDFSYTTSRQAGDGWVLVGDAGGFIDPIYSTGVNLALKSGEMAADRLHEALTAGDVSGERLSRFTPVFRQGVESLRVLVYAFYHPQFSFSRFLRQYPECRGELIDMLIGNVFDKPIDRVLEALTATMDSLEPAAATLEP
jgi:flavin-dependent dehydrogenase